MSEPIQLYDSVAACPKCNGQRWYLLLDDFHCNWNNLTGTECVECGFKVNWLKVGNERGAMTERAKIKRAIVRVSKRLLEDALPLPKGTRIVEILPDEREYYLGFHVDLIIEHEDLNDVFEGEKLPRVGMNVTEVEVDTPTFKQYETEFYYERHANDSD